MATHKFIFNLEQGGYFFRIYPKLSPPHRPNFHDQDLFSNLPDPLYNPPERLEGAVKRQLHGAFQRKFIEKKQYIIELLIEGEIILRDAILNSKETRNLFSIIQLQVQESIYNHPFQEGEFYLITPTSIQQL